MLKSLASCDKRGGGNWEKTNRKERDVIESKERGNSEEGTGKKRQLPERRRLFLVLSLIRQAATQITHVIKILEERPISDLFGGTNLLRKVAEPN